MTKRQVYCFLDTMYITSYYWYVVTTSLPCTISDILRDLQWRECMGPWELL